MYSTKSKEFQIARTKVTRKRQLNHAKETLEKKKKDRLLVARTAYRVIKNDRDRRWAGGLIGENPSNPPLPFFPLVSIGRNASGRATPTAEHDYVLTCIPAIARSHARHPLRNTPPRYRESWIRIVAIDRGCARPPCNRLVPATLIQVALGKIYRAFLLVPCPPDASSNGDTRSRLFPLDFNSQTDGRKFNKISIFIEICRSYDRDPSVQFFRSIIIEAKQRIQ